MNDIKVVPQEKLDAIGAIIEQQKKDFKAKNDNSQRGNDNEPNKHQKQTGITQNDNFQKESIFRKKPPTKADEYSRPTYKLKKGLNDNEIIAALNEGSVSDDTQSKTNILGLWNATYVRGVTDGSDIDITLARALKLWCDEDPYRIHNVMMASPWALTRGPHWDSNEPWIQISDVVSTRGLKQPDKPYFDFTETSFDSPVKLTSDKPSNEPDTNGDKPSDDEPDTNGDKPSDDESNTNGDKPSNEPDSDENSNELLFAGDLSDLFKRCSKGITRNWLVKGLIVKGDIFFIYGESNLGKSFMVLDLALRVSLGLPVLDRFKVPEKKPVIYIGPEFDEQELFIRIKAAQNLYDTDEMPMFLWDLNAFNLSDDRRVTTFIDYYSEQLEKRGWSNPLIIFDPYIMFLNDGDSNSDPAATQANAALRRINRELGATSLIVAHPTKTNSAGTKNNLKGSNFHYALSHGGLELREENKKMFLQKSKGRVFGDIDNIQVYLKEISVGVDEDGDLITTCQVSYSEPSDFDTTVTRPDNNSRLSKMDKVDVIIEYAKQHDIWFNHNDVFAWYEEETDKSRKYTKVGAFQNALVGEAFINNRLSVYLDKNDDTPAKFRIKEKALKDSST